MTGHRSWGACSEYELELQSAAFDLKFDALLGKPLTVCATRTWACASSTGSSRALSRVGTSDRYLTLRATLSPKVWLLTKTTDCRIYIEVGAEVVAEVPQGARDSPSPPSASDAGSTRVDYLPVSRDRLRRHSRIMEREVSTITQAHQGRPRDGAVGLGDCHDP